MPSLKFFALASLLFIGLQACGQSESKSPSASPKELPQTSMETPEGLEVATFGGGCFWCVEAVYEEVQGVQSVVSGYSGGHVANPSYEAICTGKTGHAEVAQIYFDPDQVSYATLLEIFWQTHNPTTLNRQGNDVGPQYRSAIFYHNEKQKEVAEKSLEAAEEAQLWPNPIVTEITAFQNFYEAEEKHQDFYAENPNYGYCIGVIRPKMEKFYKIFDDKLKKSK